MATWLEDIVSSFKNLGGIAHYSNLYKEIQHVRAESFPQSFEAIIRRNIEEHSSDSNVYDKEYEDLFYSVNGIGKGIWGLREFRGKAPIASDISEPERSEGKKSEIYRILRDTQLIRKLKNLHSFECQICRETLLLRNGMRYAEGHHIQPLGSPHNGPDKEENILILCPNHHALCDARSIILEIKKLRIISGHQIDNRYIAYHNDMLIPEVSEP